MKTLKTVEERAKNIINFAHRAHKAMYPTMELREKDIEKMAITEITQDRQDILNAVVEGLKGMRHKWTRTDSMKEIYRAGANHTLDQAITLITELLEDKTN